MKKKTPASVYLVILAAVVIDGTIVAPGDLVEVTAAEARNLLDRGRARLATADDGAPEPDEDEAPASPAGNPAPAGGRRGRNAQADA